MTASRSERLRLNGICKRYGDLKANDDIDLVVGAGEIHAVLGENGAGKSTLMKIIYGVTQPDSGKLYWEGQAVDIPNPAMARQLGIGMVFQHFALFQTLTVAQNIALALDVAMDDGELARRITEVSQRYGLPIDPRRLIHTMSVGERQRVEIVRCLLQSPRLLIMDEPTSVLTPMAVQTLFVTLRRLASEGVSILYISHKLDEIRALCDAATVLRSGKIAGHTLPQNESNDSLARLMVGSAPAACVLEPRETGDKQLEVAGYGLASSEAFGVDLADINLTVRSGEIVGIAGVSGNGQKELAAALSGEAIGPHSGWIRIAGQLADDHGPTRRRAMGMAFVPEERLGRGAVPTLSLADNTLLTCASMGLTRLGVLRPKRMAAYAREVITKFKVRCNSEQSIAQSLSGGNLQKFIVGREIGLAPKLLVVSQPTWGVDVNAAQLIRNAIIDLRNSGAAILVISEELDELFMICDRIAVITKGKLSEAYPHAQCSIESIGLMMSGSEGELHG